MTLRLIVGRANIGKTGAALSIVRDALATGREPVLVLPSQPDVQRAADELASTSPLGFRVKTFDAFLEDAWSQCGDGRAIVSGSARGLLATAAARRAGVGSGMGVLATACIKTLAEQHGEAWRNADPAIDGVGGRLAETILQYRDAITELGLVEPEEAAFAISRSGRQTGSPVVVHRFIDFAPWQERMIVGLAESRDVAVTLTWEEGFAPTAALDELVARLGADLIVTGGEPFHTEPELAAVANGLFSDPTGALDSGCVRFSLAEGHEAEAHRIAEEVRDALAKYGTKDAPASIAVVFRHPERHFRFLKEAFEEAGVDAEFDVRLPLGATPFGAAVLALVRFVLAGDRDLLLAVMKSPFGGCVRSDVVALEREWRRQGTVERNELVVGVGRVGRELQRTIRDIGNCARGAVDAPAARELAAAVSGLLVLGYGRGSAQNVAREDASAHAAIQRLLGEVARLDDDSLQLQDVLDGLQRSIVTSPVEERKGVVQVTAVDRIRGRRYDAVIIGGLNTDEFPSTPAEHMLPGSSVADVLAAFGGAGYPPKGGAFEQLLFYMALTRAQHRVVLSARTADSDGDPAGVSPLFEDVADFYRPQNDPEARPKHEFRALSQPPRSGGLTTEREQLRSRADAGGTDPRSRGALWRSRRRLSSLVGDSSIEWLTRSDVYSPSALDLYLECPYRWFYTRAIRPEELKAPFDVRSQGTFAHEVLARTYTRLQEQGTPRVTSGNVTEAVSVARGEWHLLDAEQGPPASVTERSQRRVTLQWIERVLAYDASFAPGYAPSKLEWRFGFGEDEPIDLGGFSLRGIVDRVDVDGSGHAIVIDYKRSGGPSAEDILKKRKIQVPLYFEAVRRGLGLVPVAGLYRGLQTCTDRGLIRDGSDIDGKFTGTDIRCAEEFDAIVEGALGLAREAVAGIRSGSIEQKPFNISSCASCPAHAVCGGAR